MGIFSKPRRPWFPPRIRPAEHPAEHPAERPPRRKSYFFFNLFSRLLGLILLVALVWTLYVVHQINKLAAQDQAQPSDAIAVFGAAEYSGRPSPVYHARLDHAVALYGEGIAPIVITLGGGSDKDSGKTEGGVGRDYLLANGVPFANIIAETHSFTTSQQAHRLADISRERGLRTLVVVSDPTHLFRIQQLCQQDGLNVYTSPRRPLGRISDYDVMRRYFHEIVSYTAQRLHLSDTRFYRWLDGKSD
jgi:uncharacterized SAM-binding protein YcdF (DUF218 family)